MNHMFCMVTKIKVKRKNSMKKKFVDKKKSTGNYRLFDSENMVMYDSRLKWNIINIIIIYLSKIW